LFRIVASTDDNEEIGYYDIYAESNSTEVEDRYHKSGFGKLYIMR